MLRLAESDMDHTQYSHLVVHVLTFPQSSFRTQIFELVVTRVAVDTAKKVSAYRQNIADISADAESLQSNLYFRLELG